MMPRSTYSETAGNICEPVCDETSRAGFSDGEGQFFSCHELPDESFQRIFIVGEDIGPESGGYLFFYPRQGLADGVFILSAGSQHDMVLREHRVKTYSHTGAGKIHISELFVDGCLGQAKGFNGTADHLTSLLGKRPLQERDHTFRQHSCHLARNAGNDNDQFAVMPQGKTCCGAGGVGNHFGACREIRLFGIVFRPVQPVFLESRLEIRQDSFVSLQRKAKTRGNGGRCDVIGCRAKSARYDHRIGVGHDKQERPTDRFFHRRLWTGPP